MEKAERAEFNVPTCGSSAVCQLCRERQPLWNSHDVCLDQCHGVPMTEAPPKAGAKELFYSLPSKFDP